jgi:hypothetical protein
MWRSRHIAAAIAVVLTCSSGCAVFVENRYSVFGFDRLMTDSVATAKTWSLILLSGVSVFMAIVGALSFWLVQRWRDRRKQAAFTDEEAAYTLSPREPQPASLPDVLSAARQP